MKKSVIVLEPNKQFVDSPGESPQPCVAYDVTFSQDFPVIGYGGKILREGSECLNREIDEGHGRLVVLGSGTHSLLHIVWIYEGC